MREETPAQRKARMDADFRMRAGPFSWIWSWGIDQQFKSTTTSKKSNNKDSTSWYGLFGRSSTSELLKLEIESAEASQVFSPTYFAALLGAIMGETRAIVCYESIMCYNRKVCILYLQQESCASYNLSPTVHSPSVKYNQHT